MPIPESAEPCLDADGELSTTVIFSDDADDDSDDFMWCIIVAVADLESDAPLCFFEAAEVAAVVTFLTSEADLLAFLGTAPPVTDMRAADATEETEFLRCSCVE